LCPRHEGDADGIEDRPAHENARTAIAVGKSAAKRRGEAPEQILAGDGDAVDLARPAMRFRDRTGEEAEARAYSETEHGHETAGDDDDRRQVVPGGGGSSGQGLFAHGRLVSWAADNRAHAQRVKLRSLHGGPYDGA